MYRDRQLPSSVNSTMQRVVKNKTLFISTRGIYKVDIYDKYIYIKYVDKSIIRQINNDY